MPVHSPLRPQRPPVTSATVLAKQVGAKIVPFGGERAAQVTGIELRAQNVEPGDLFAALPGARSHGARFVPDAIERGAVAVLTDPDGLDRIRAEDVQTPLTVLVHDEPRSVLGEVSATVYGHPSARMDVIGITGTSGKTTTSYLVENALRAAGRSPGLIGTIETRIGEQPVPSALTTPEAPHLHAMFAAMLEQGVDTVVMEVSSHALALGRVDGTQFAVGAFTNLSQDHMDFHDSFEDYFLTKSRLFAAESSVHAARAVVCVDDEWGKRMAGIARAATDNVVTVGGTAVDADWTVSEWAVDADGAQTFTVEPGGVQASLRLPGRYNVANALLAAAACAALDLDPAGALASMSDVDVPGRMQRIDRGQPFLAVVDYAHKPAALDAVLDTLRSQVDGRIAVVVGAGGDRDADKRPLMGAAAAAGADLAVITDDNPRSEDPAAIRAAVAAGAESVPVDRRGEIRVVDGRRDAIVAAVQWARAGDVVLVAGKGHEVGQEIDGVKHPFDDRTVLADAIDSVMTSTGGQQ